MKILWITNIMLPPICKELNLPMPAVGGWMYSSLKRLQIQTNDTIGVATTYSGNSLLIRQIDSVVYYLLPLNGANNTDYNSNLEIIWKQIYQEFNPDIVHIHGSEYPHGLAYLKACGNRGVVLSIQGIISVICRYYTLDGKYSRFLWTFRDFIKNGGLKKSRLSLEKRGNLEIDLIKNVNHIIGRTDWDKAHSWALNPAATYHYCGETMRDSFYTKKWSYSNCEPQTIFVSQGSYPIKGLHKLLEAMPLILRHYPKTKIYVAGDDPTSKPWYLITGYGKFLKRIIRNNNLKDKVIFLGMLDEESMCNRYLSSNLFVCPSAIENSPNSLGEAQLLGIPTIASFVGGIPGMTNMNNDILYRYEEIEMLAHKVCKVFEAKDSVQIPPFNFEMYNPDTNLHNLISIYQKVANS